MNDITAAIALVQLAKLDKMNARRSEIARRYTRAFKGHSLITAPPSIPKGCLSSWHIYCIRAKRRDELSIYLQEKEIATGVHYKPIHTYKCYGNRPVLPKAESVFKEILSLPMYPGLSNDDVDRVIGTILSFYDGRM